MLHVVFFTLHVLPCEVTLPPYVEMSVVLCSVLLC